MGSGVSEVSGSVQALQNLFGKKDKSATNQVDGQGNVVATNSAGSQTVADPNQGLTPGQKLARGLLSTGLNGVRTYGQQAQQQNGPLGGPSNPFFGQGY